LNYLKNTFFPTGFGALFLSYGFNLRLADWDLDKDSDDPCFNYTDKADLFRGTFDSSTKYSVKVTDPQKNAYAKLYF